MIDAEMADGTHSIDLSGSTTLMKEVEGATGGSAEAIDLPATAARITDGCQPTARVYAPIAASTPSWAAARETPSTHARPRTPQAMNATFWPLTASRW